MNVKTTISKSFCLLVILVLSTLVTSCSLWEIFSEGREWETNIRNEQYTNNPSTLLENIREGKEGTFTLLKATPPVYPPQPNTVVIWKQVDYWSIAEAFHQYVWHEPLPEKELIYIKFYLDCNEVELGPQSAMYKFVNVTKIGEDETRIDRTVIIDPSSSQAYAWESSYNPNYSQYKYIDLHKVNIPVETALSFAEKNGGEKFRLKYKNECVISAKLDPNGYYDGWVIEYLLPDSENERIKLVVNTMTGDIKELR